MLKIQSTHNKIVFKKTGLLSAMRDAQGIKTLKQRPRFRLARQEQSYEKAIEMETTFVCLEENAKRITSDLISRLRGGLTEIAEVPS